MKNENVIEKYQRIVVSILLIIVAVPALILNTVDFSPHKLIIESDNIKVGIESFQMEDIKSIDIVEKLDINYRVKGTSTLTYLRGWYKIVGENKDASVYIYKNKEPYIRIELEDELLIYNDKNRNDTETTYKELIESINNNE